MQGCISDTNGGNGVSITSTGIGLISVANCDIYNNSSDGINFSSASSTNVWIENTNFVKNTGAGINNTATGDVNGYIYNCGYGAGTQANGSADTLGRLSKSGTVTYASNVTPWADPENGDFRITLPAAYNVGRGTFTETAASYTGTVGYPDIGAANHNDSCAGTGPCQTSGASAY